MSLHIEWDTSAACITLHEQGEEFPGYEDPITAPYGLLIGGDGGGALMVEGSREELLAFLDRARAVIGPEQIPTERASLVSDPNDISYRPTAPCGCGFPLVWVTGGWEHDAAPSLWGDDHEPDAPIPHGEQREHWDREDGVFE